MRSRNITETVWVLSLVSLFTDVASEMLYPVMPIYLKSINYSVVFIGLLEGVAEAVAGFSKGYFGNLSDTVGKRVPFVRLGYLLSAISKPMMAIFTFPAWIFSARTLDRLGKGIRTGARDALLSDEATAETKGTVFGFHRSMDTLGAVIGPLCALLYLHYHANKYKSLFLIAFIPGIIAVIIAFLLRDKKVAKRNGASKQNIFSFLKYWSGSSAEYKKLVIGLLIFTLFNSSDVFLLLRIKSIGYPDEVTIGIYVFYNVAYAALAYPLGILADKIGLKTVFVAGLVIFAGVYAGMGVTSDIHFIICLFFCYGIYAASTEGVSKAWISNIVSNENVATAIGAFTAFQSISLMFASAIAGVLWLYWGATVTFAITGIAAVLVAVYISIVIPKPGNGNSSH